jgi:Universal stress protein family
MSKRILLGVDTPMSSATQYALRTVSELIEQTSPRVVLVLLHIIPVPYITSPTPGIYAGHIQTAAEGIVKGAKDLHADLIVIGSQGNTLRERLRRIFAGSVSRKVLQLAPCPVMIVTCPRIKQPSDLVAWYTEAITYYLHEHPGGLMVFTPGEVAEKFAPPSTDNPGRKEIAAAILALEQLAHEGVLCRHDVKGEMRYVND